MGVVLRPRRPSTRPVKWVTNWLPADKSSCNSHVMSIIRQPRFLNHFKKSSQRLASRSRTRSKTSGKPDQPFMPLTGPNIGCVQRMSHDSGSKASNVVLAWAFTDSTSTTMGPLFAAPALDSRALMHFANFRTTVSKLNTLTAMTTMSRSLSIRSAMFMHHVTPQVAASLEASIQFVTKTSKSNTIFLAMNCPKVPNPTMPHLCLLTSGSGDCIGRWPSTSSPMSEPPAGYEPRMRKNVVISCRCLMALAAFG
mmetsp:Transcript_29717/g.81372  ORF Transcript_29717/g.81372 Transcript_29717/m.81372 type:complete len:253 (-) Transcript_29717:1011-1769(-)